MKYSNPKIPEGINSSESNPLKEFALLTTGAFTIIIALVYVLSSLLDWSSQFIPFNYEQKIAQPFVDEFINSNAHKLDKDSEVVATYLQTLTDKITPLISLEDDVKIILHYINEDTVNGMATLGGHIFIYRGLLEKLPSENALVMLLAHEVAHVKLRHPVRALSKGVLVSLLVAVISGQNNSDLSGILASSSQLAFLNFSRTQEQDADNEAIRLNHQYYQHTQGAVDLFKVLLAESEQDNNIETLPFLRSHPEVKQRIDEVKMMSELNHWAQQGKLTLIPSHIIEQLEQDKIKVVTEK
jgi:predicted Zn-dependent protease